MSGTLTLPQRREAHRRGLTKTMLAQLAARGYSPEDFVRARIRNTAPVGADATRIPIPTDQAGLEAMMTDEPTLRVLFANKDNMAEFIRNYGKAVWNQDQSIATQVREQVQNVMTEFLKSQEADNIARPNLTGADFGAMLNNRGKAHAHNPRAMGAKLDREFENSAEYFRTIWHAAEHTADRQNKLGRVRNAFSSNVPSEGGFLIPETLRSEILRVSLETSIVRPRARVIPMESLRVPFPAIDATSNASTVYGGIVAYWTEEGAALTASQANFSRIVLDAKKLTAYTEIPNELIADSIGSFMAFMDDIFPEALGFYEDYAFIQGTGVGEPLGFLKSAAMISVTKEAGQANDTIVWENIVKMYSRMLPNSLNRAVWICSIDTFPELATMALSVGTGGSAIWLNNGQVGPPMTILGRPVIFSEKVPKLGDLGDLNFVDLGFYLVGDRQVMSAMSSPHFKFQNDVTAYRIIERVDGRPWLQSAITPKNSGATLSPFVQLEAR